MERVSDEWLDEQISYYDGLGNEVSGLGMARCAALVELRDRRAAEREQAAPTEPRLAKWERQMREAQIILWPPRIAGQNQTDKWIAHIWSMGEWSADTAKAAVKAAWRAWKEARGE